MSESARRRIGAVTLVDEDINELTDRAAMGLPDHYVAPRAAEVADVAGLWGAGIDELQVRLADADASLETRISAGTLLALLGDTRVRPLDPPMVDVPGGVFAMGTAESDVDELLCGSERYGVRRNWIVKECPRHEAEVGDFRIAVHPVTNAEYAAYLIDTEDSELPTGWHYGRFQSSTSNHPVYTVTPDAADRYVTWLAARTGRAFRLPTETEWEYAASGSAGQRYTWGEQWQPEHANTLETGLLTTTPVGAFPGGQSWCGALDMAGNVEEYVVDRYQPYPGGEIVHDDLFKRMGNYRIARGGAFNRFKDLARNQRRHGPYPRSLYAMGFRIAEDGSGECL